MKFSSFQKIVGVELGSKTSVPGTSPDALGSTVVLRRPQSRKQSIHGMLHLEIASIIRKVMATVTVTSELWRIFTLQLLILGHVNVPGVG